MSCNTTKYYLIVYVINKNRNKMKNDLNLRLRITNILNKLLPHINGIKNSLDMQKELAQKILELDTLNKKNNFIPKFKK
jgi:hypothetical protein